MSYKHIKGHPELPKHLQKCLCEMSNDEYSELTDIYQKWYDNKWYNKILNFFGFPMVQL